MGDFVSIYRSSAPPMPGDIMVHCFVVPIPLFESVGHYSQLIHVVENGKREWFMDENDIETISAAVVKQLFDDPSIVQTCETEYHANIAQCQQLLDRESVLERLNKMSAQERVHLFAESAQLYERASAYVEPVGFSLEIAGHQLLKERILEELDAQQVQLAPADFESYFATLVNFSEISFVQRSELSLLQIALMPESERPEGIQKHVEDFYWQVYDYYGPLIDAQTAELELQAYLNLGAAEIQKRIQDIERSQVEAETKITEAENQYALSDNVLAVIRTARRWAFFYSDIKKEQTSRANVGFGVLTQWLSERMHVDQHLLHYATTEEIEMLLGASDELQPNAHSELIDQLNARKKESVYVVSDKNAYYSALNSSDAEEARSLIKTIDGGDVQQFKGMPANSGMYTGRVQVVMNASQCHKVQQGDVLVAPMTAVNYVPAMKKAGAIVTDLGGITSHASIVSRELGVPCIVGSKIATSILRDGDTVEVNGKHGHVRIIKREAE